MDWSWLNAHTIFLIGHIFGVAIGAGAAFTGDVLFLTAIKDKHLSHSEVRTIDIVGRIVWVGLAILIISGIGLVMQRPEIFLNSQKFWAKMTIVAIIAINGLAFHFVHRPVFRESVGKEFTSESKIVKRRNYLMLSGAVSVTSWAYVIVLGTFGRLPFTYIQFIGLYLFLITLGVATAIPLGKKIISPKN